MKSGKWEEVSALFQIALDCDPDKRADLLGEKCGGDEELRREVEELLRLHNDDDNTNFLADPAFEISAKLLTENFSPSLEGRQIGSYKIQRELGKGGMGVVCLAVRDDEFRKRVALKLVKRGMDTDEILARFRHERQILASLDHPNIARLLDGGTTDDGLPFFVMEYVEGEAIDKYCESERLSIEERLKLFQKVCAAVSYAHQNLVVHRDLKPSNILVGSDGEPKLLDFGIAKLLKPDLFPSVVAPTGLIMRPMTPDYASPEQVKGLPITTASDVYSLGVLLYELLTGQRPYQFNSNNAAEIERIVCETDPKLPSAVLSPKFETDKLQTNPKSKIQNPKLLKGDLDNILLKALRKESHRRYSSVEQFSEDIRRHQAGLPVLAHENNFRYRASKFIRRHRIPLSIAALFAILIVGFGVALGLQTIRAERAKVLAEQQRTRAEKVSNFLAEIFKVSDPNLNKGNTITAREILDKGAARVETEMADQPETQAALLHTIGQVYDSLGFFDQAQPRLEKALQLRRSSFGNNSEEVAETLKQLAQLHIHKVDYAAAETVLTEALAIRRKLNGNADEKTADILRELGAVYLYKQDLGTAETLLQEALTILDQGYGGEYPLKVRVLGVLGMVADGKGDFVATEKFFREAVILSRKVNGEDHLTTALSIGNLASCLEIRQNNLIEAEQLHRERIRILRKLYGNENTHVAYGLINLGGLLESKKDYAAAEESYREALLIRRNLYGDEHSETNVARRHLARFLTYQRKFDEAETALHRTLASFQKQFGETHAETIATKFVLAILLHEKGDRAAAEKIFRQILPSAREKKFVEGYMLSLILVEFGKILVKDGKAQEAEPLLREGLEALRKSELALKWQTAEAESAFGECLLALGKREEAKPLLEEGYRLLDERLGAERKWMVERARQRLSKLQ